MHYSTNTEQHSIQSRILMKILSLCIYLERKSIQHKIQHTGVRWGVVGGWRVVVRKYILWLWVCCVAERAHGAWSSPPRGVREAADMPEQLWHPVPQIHHLHWRRGALWLGGLGVHWAAEDQEGTQPAAEAVRPVQQRHWCCARLLRHLLVRSGHRQDHGRAAGVPEQVLLSVAWALHAFLGKLFRVLRHWACVFPHKFWIWPPVGAVLTGGIHSNLTRFMGTSNFRCFTRYDKYIYRKQNQQSVRRTSCYFVWPILFTKKLYSEREREWERECVCVCVCVCVLCIGGSRVFASTALVVAWVAMCLTSYSDYLTGFCEPHLPAYRRHTCLKNA